MKVKVDIIQNYSKATTIEVEIPEDVAKDHVLDYLNKLNNDTHEFQDALSDCSLCLSGDMEIEDFEEILEQVFPETRMIELYVGDSSGGDSGSWHTDYVDIPRDTLPSEIIAVAIAKGKEDFPLHTFIGLCNIMPLEESDETHEYYGQYAVSTNYGRYSYFDNIHERDELFQELKAKGDEPTLYEYTKQGYTVI